MTNSPTITSLGQAPWKFVLLINLMANMYCLSSPLHGELVTKLTKEKSINTTIIINKKFKEKEICS